MINKNRYLHEPADIGRSCVNGGFFGHFLCINRQGGSLPARCLSDAFSLFHSVFTFCAVCVILYITGVKQKKVGEDMYLEFIEIDFNSEEAIYMQLRNQIIWAIATDGLHEGEVLPSVRQLADRIGINMHTVNKAYTVLKQEGILTIDRRRGAVVRIDADKLYAKEELRSDLKYVLAKAFCKNISKEEVHEMVDEIYEEYK